MKPDVTDPFLMERLEKYEKWLGDRQIPYASKVVPVAESIEARKWCSPGLKPVRSSGKPKPWA